MIIESMIDEDYYKLTMSQAVIAKFPNTHVKYKFINRGDTKFTKRFVDNLYYEIAEMQNLQVSTSELMFLTSRAKDLYPPFIEWFSKYRYNPNEVSIDLKDGDLQLEIQGPWYRTILWEVKLMALISELYFQDKGYSEEDTRSKAAWKARFISDNNIKVVDFGTRRRFSNKVHELVIKEMRDSLAGTSNLKMAMKYDLPVVGTMAHEWIMAQGALYGYTTADFGALMTWRKVYGKNLSVALTDTYTSDVFFKNRLGVDFDGLRQDSGDPIKFIDKAIAYYKRHGIDPASKKIIFSDSLNVLKAADIANHCRDKIPCVFGIGTNLTNDVYCAEPLNMVIKMTAFSPNGEDWIPTVKLSDSPGKHTGDPEEVEKCKSALGIS